MLIRENTIIILLRAICRIALVHMCLSACVRACVYRVHASCVHATTRNALSIGLKSFLPCKTAQFSNDYRIWGLRNRSKEPITRNRRKRIFFPTTASRRLKRKEEKKIKRKRINRRIRSTRRSIILTNVNEIF